MSTLEEDKLKECKIIFDMFDENKDNKISLNELGDILRICGAAPSQQELMMIIKNLEENGNENISFEIFIKLLERLLNTQDSEEDLINEFRKIDKVGDGTMAASDLKKLMSNYENPLQSQEIDEIIQEANVDENGYINIQRFVKLLLGNI
jgi:calmodulin